MKKLFLFICCLYLGKVSSLYANDTTKFDHPTHPVFANNAAINRYVKGVMQTHEIPGLALAVVKNGKTIYKQYYGRAFANKSTPVAANSMFRVYSTTKLITSVAIFQLMEQGKLALNDNVALYLKKLPAHWQHVQIQHLLTHSSGLPDIIKYPSNLSDQTLMARLSADPMEFETGSRFYYNQTNYWLLAQVIEQLSGQSFATYVLQKQFSGNRQGVLFSSNSTANVPNRVVKMRYDIPSKTYKPTTHNNGARAHSGNGLNITLDKLIEWGNRLDNNDLLRNETKQQMWARFNFSHPKDVFLHGWGVYKVNQASSYGFTGGGVSAFRKFPKEDMTIILLTNGYKHMPIHNTIVNRVAGMVIPTLANPQAIVREQVQNSFIQNTLSNALKNYTLAKKQHPSVDFESVINSVGYIFLGANKVKEAIQVFELNVKDHPKSSNTYDSLGEAYFDNKNYKASRKSYQKSLELNPRNRNAARMLEKIKKVVVD